MKSAYQIIRRPVITEKGLGVKETEATLVFEVAVKASKTTILMTGTEGVGAMKKADAVAKTYKPVR